MRYIDSHLMSGEEVVARAHLHPIIFASPVLLTIVAILLSAPLFFLVPLVAFIFTWINYRTSEFAVTNKRVLFKTGFIRRRSEEILLTKVEGIQVKQGILGRILGYGSVVVSGTGGSRDPYTRIAAPMTFRRCVQEQVAAIQDGSSQGRRRQDFA